MPQSSKEMQDRAKRSLQEARWPILAKLYLRASQLVSQEGWADLEAQLTAERLRVLNVLAHVGIDERIADAERGKVEILDWLLRLREDVKEFPK